MTDAAVTGVAYLKNECRTANVLSSENEMKLTRHAKKQAQRRGIRSEALDLIVEHGEDYGAGDGCQLYRISRGEMKFIGRLVTPHPQDDRRHAQQQ